MREFVSLFTKLAFIMPSPFKGTIVHIVIMLIKSGNDVKLLFTNHTLWKTNNWRYFVLENNFNQVSTLLSCQWHWKKLLPSSSTTCTTICGLSDNFSLNHQQRQEAYILFCPSTYEELAALSTLLVVPQAGFLKDFVMYSKWQ